MCCEITLLLRSDFATFLYSRVYFLLKMPNVYREREAGNLKREAGNLKVEANFAALRVQLGVAKLFRSPLECLRNLADTIFILRNGPQCFPIFATDTLRYFSSDFCCLNPKILLVSHQLHDSLVFKLVKRLNIYVIISFKLCSYIYLSGACSQRRRSFCKSFG